MKKVFITIFLLGALAALGFFMFKLGKSRALIKQALSPTPAVKGVSTISFEGEEYAYQAVRVEDASRIKLLPNFSEQKTSEEIINEGMCKNLVNAGFYSENFTPIGLFISEREILKQRQTNATFNGFFLISEGEIPEILKEMRDEEYRVGLQSGPILIIDSTAQKLNLKAQEQEKDRRMVVALNSKGEIFFIVLYLKNSVFSGPRLASLPSVLLEVQDSLSVNFTSAINLDGGAASTFWGEGVNLKELSPIGSYFCIN